MTGANVYNGPCKQIEEKRRVNENRMKDHPKSSLINPNKQYFLHYYFTTMTRQDTHSHLGFLLSELLLSWHSLHLILLSPSCVFAAILSYLKYVLFCPIQKPSVFFCFFFLIYKSLVHWSLVGKLCAVLLMSTGAQQEVSTSPGLSPNAEIMALPGFHEILHLLACPPTIIHILDDSIVPGRGG